MSNIFVLIASLRFTFISTPLLFVFFIAWINAAINNQKSRRKAFFKRETCKNADTQIKARICVVECKFEYVFMFSVEREREKELFMQMTSYFLLCWSYVFVWFLNGVDFVISYIRNIISWQISKCAQHIPDFEVEVVIRFFY